MDLGSSILTKFNFAEWNEDIVFEWLKLLKLKLRTKNITHDMLVQGLREAGSRFQSEHPLAFPLLNVINRVVNLSMNPGTLRKFRATKNLTNILSDLHSMIELPSLENDASFEELTDELLSAETDTEEIVALAQKHLLANNVTMIYASSKLAIEFALKAVEKPGVSVILVKNTLIENYVGFMPDLIENYTVIPDICALSFMHRVDKFFIDAFAVLADGSLLHDAGLCGLCTAAREFAVPVIVLAPLYKFTPFYAFSQETFNTHISPLSHWPELRGYNSIDFMLLKFDHIPAECVKVIVSQAGEFPPPFVFRALAEYYGCSELGYNFK